MLPDLGKYAEKLFIDPVQGIHEHASSMCAELRELCELSRQVTPAAYDMYSDELGAAEATHAALLTVLDFERLFLFAVRDTTGELLRDFKRVGYDAWQKAASVLGIAPTETKPSFLQKLTLKYLDVQSLIDNDVDNLRRWQDLDSVRPFLLEEENALQAKRSHLQLVGRIRGDRTTMDALVRASKRMLDAHLKHFKKARPWIEGKHGRDSEAARLMHQRFCDLYVWYANSRADSFSRRSASMGPLALIDPKQRLALNAAKDRIDDQTSNSQNQQLSVHFRNAEASFEVEDRKPDPVRSDEHLHRDGEDESDGEARTQPRHYVRQRRGEHHTRQRPATAEPQEIGSLDVSAIDRGGALDGRNKDGPERTERDDEDV